ncbi:DUF1648 domain-containing protein [Thermaerobacillus caldiproteolyticus]|uniref:DUF1648 domain-containing protein n=1 Tax=Thermaerobacillus caldiproteolyticus TaxID=247480 RepID=UPI0018F1A47B|nr:DUF1648 domain-containing protein [Anoxybacillus caldiproteolyticus]
METSTKEKTKLEKILFVMSIFGLVAVFIYVMFIWSHLPETIPRHFNFKGSRTDSAEKVTFSCCLL